MPHEWNRRHKGLTLKTPTAQVCATGTRFRAATSARDKGKEAFKPLPDRRIPSARLSKAAALCLAWSRKGLACKGRAAAETGTASALISAHRRSTSPFVLRCTPALRDMVLQAGRDDSNDAANLPEILPKAKRRDSHDSSQPTTRPAFPGQPVGLEMGA